MSVRPRLSIELYMTGELQRPLNVRFPHCDARILHAPEECTYCASASDLQAERERLRVNNTGRTDRLWPCPAEKTRSLETMERWGGNRPKKDV